MLHIVNKSPFERNSLESCLKHAVKGSAILLIEDGIYAALKGTQATTQVQEQTLTFAPKLVAVVLALLIAGPWIERWAIF